MPQVGQQGGGVVGPLADAQGRSMSAVWPWACCSTPMIWRPLASAGMIPPKSTPMVDRLPWSRTSGRPPPAVDLVAHLQAVDRGVAGGLGHGDVLLLVSPVVEQPVEPALPGGVGLLGVEAPA
jgi:hypothetical protein